MSGNGTVLPGVPPLNPTNKLTFENGYAISTPWKNGGGRPIDADNLNKMEEELVELNSHITSIKEYTSEISSYSVSVNSNITSIITYLTDYANTMEETLNDIGERFDGDESDLSEFKLIAMGAIAASLSEAEAYAKSLVDALSGGTDIKVADLQSQIASLSGTLETYKSALEDKDIELKNGYESADSLLSGRITALETTIDGGEIE